MFSDAFQNKEINTRKKIGSKLPPLFALISASGVYLALKLGVVALIGGQPLKVGGVYFKVR